MIVKPYLKTLCDWIGVKMGIKCGCYSIVIQFGIDAHMQIIPGTIRFCVFVSFFPKRTKSTIVSSFCFSEQNSLWCRSFVDSILFTQVTQEMHSVLAMSSAHAKSQHNTTHTLVYKDKNNGLPVHSRIASSRHDTSPIVLSSVCMKKTKKSLKSSLKTLT